MNAEVRLLQGSPGVLALFRRDPFRGRPPGRVRAVLWQYWFSSREEKEKTGRWWRRRFLGAYGPGMERRPDGTIAVVEAASRLPE